jgi:membrane associated rhomboid family serine protease
MHASKMAAHMSESKLAVCLLAIGSVSWLLSNVMAFSIPHYFAFTPANTVLSHFFLWNLVTQLVVELDALSFVVSCATILSCVIPVEQRLGTERILLLVLMATVASSLVMIMLSALLYGVTGSFWLYQAFAGFAPGAVVCAVVRYHLTRGSDYVITSSSALLSAIRTRHLPFLIVLYAAMKDVWSRFLFPTESSIMTEMDIGSADEIFEGPMLPMVLLNFVGTWGLIRFYGLGWVHLSSHRSAAAAVSDDATTIGEGPDVSTSFALHQFIFPVVLQRSVLAATTAGFRLARVLGIGKDIEKAEQQAAAAGAEYARDNEFSAFLPVPLPAATYQPSSAAGAALSSLAPLPGSTAADADRRRAVALAALTARLQQHQLGGKVAEHGESSAGVSLSVAQDDDGAFSLHVKPHDDTPDREYELRE